MAAAAASRSYLPAAPQRLPSTPTATQQPPAVSQHTPLHISAVLLLLALDLLPSLLHSSRSGSKCTSREKSYGIFVSGTPSSVPPHDSSLSVVSPPAESLCLAPLLYQDGT